MSEMEKIYFSIVDRISKAASQLAKIEKYPRLVAASKTKPVSMIIQLYNIGQRDFGENYIDELVEKSQDSMILKHCPEIRWHFIGHLQSNKVNKIIDLPNLSMIETVDSEKLANKLNNALTKTNLLQKLKVMVQINTSNEENKSGCEINQCVSLVSHILANCPNLSFVGLMTIGLLDQYTLIDPNPDFMCLVKCRESICQKLNLNSVDVELSMGMSNDFEQAIKYGSTNVRIGSLLFGPR